ncbi:hypothetical protein EJD97_004593 [Solanum chilense]|uniref:Ubiquitin carboxyl-terminal hydrolase n=1 Tax=Solanum chilense TaxID=4083 RepID=A0A6N2CDZ0_SOLCI|nr:hypothetical protein EJD97_004593 [Solanum chilense]
MGEATIDKMEENLGQEISGLIGSDPGLDTSSSVFHRKIEFHLARKPFNGFISGKNNGGFQLETLNPSSETRKENGSLVSAGKKGGGDVVMESNGMDPEVSFGIAFRKIMRIGAGLQNLGNTCFLNSVLQCLTYTEPLAAYLESGKHQSSCRMAGFCALCAIQKHVSRALQATGKILAPKDLVSNLRCISRNFRNARQEDAHEYMVNLLESMHKCCLPSGVPSESPSAYEKSLVHKIFGGRLRSQVQCMQCKFCSDKFDPFLDLSLEILRADSLLKALDHFTARELLDGGQRQYQCQQCKQKVKATKRLTIDRAPHVLTVHLKRFGSHVPGQKIDKKIHYGPTLDLKHFVSDTYSGELKYTLYGVLVHAGWSTHSGHYYCFVRTSSGNWYSLDDNQVVQVSERKVLEQKAYMLFYVRDKKSPVPKKSVDVARNDNVITNGIGNKISSNHSQRFKDTAQNGFHVKNEGSLSGTKDQREKLSAEVSKGTSTKDLTPPKVNGAVVSGFSSHGGAIQPKNLPKVQETGDSVKHPSVVDAKDGPSLLKANPAVPVCNGTHRLDNKGDARCGDSTPLPNGNVTIKELTCSAAIPFHFSSVNSDKDPSTPAKLLNKQVECSKADTNIQVVKGISNGSLGGSAVEVNNDVGQRKAGAESAGVLSQPTMTSSAEKVAIDKACLKAKKKSFKSRVTKLHLSFMILDPALGLNRKKKRMNHRIGKRKRSNPSSMDESNSDLGPSTSKLSHTLISSPMQSQRKKSKLGSNEKVSSTAGHNGDLLRNTVNDERVVNNGTVLANDKQPQKSSSLAPVGSQGVDSRQSTESKETKVVATRKGLLNMLTRGLESSVARWDDVEVRSLKGVEAQNGNCVTIGYIGDEWDEEYDTGKRRKIRSSKIEFGGPNLFQDFASKKTKVKKARLERSSSANQPFRIL